MYVCKSCSDELIALDEDGVSNEIIEKVTEGKPEAMLENIAKGKLRNFSKTIL